MFSFPDRYFFLAAAAVDENFYLTVMEFILTYHLKASLVFLKKVGISMTT